MKCALIYFSQSGSTLSVAEAVVEALNEEGYMVELFSLTQDPPQDLSGYDLLGFATPVYYFRLPFNMADYLHSVSGLEGKATFYLLLHGTYPGEAGEQLRQLLLAKGAEEPQGKHFYGADFFLGYLQQGVLFSPGRPSEEDLAQAKIFGWEVMQKRNSPIQPTKLEFIYKLEQFFTNRWLVKNIYSQLFFTNTDCSGCGRCQLRCPTTNITADNKKRPIWGKDCLLCLTCEAACPTGAIVSPVSWPLFKPFMAYNVRKASTDPSIEKEKFERRK